jgi:GT2 family glycosyltransferase
LNPDIRVTAGAIEGLAQFLDSHPQAGAVGGYVNEKYLPRRLPTISTFVREDLGLPVPPSGDAKAEQPAAAALMIRRTAFDAIGGFDERFFPAWYEDVDFCQRLKSAGWEIHFMPEAHFHHVGGYSAEALGKKAFTQAYYHNQLRYSQKHFGRLASVAVRASIVAGMLARMIARPQYARAYGSVLRGALGGW